MINYLIFGIIAYLLGSIPTAVWIGKAWNGIDVREHGSKNAGATNTFRVLGKKPGITVLFIDIIKGFLAVSMPIFFLMSGYFSSNSITKDEIIYFQIIASFSAVLGHVFPVFASFKGGKGVATSLGVIIGIHPPAALLCLLLFLIIFVAFHYVSLGAICSSIAFPLTLFYVFEVKNSWLIIFSVILGILVILSHRKNIGRLIKGEESKMKLFKK